MVDVRMWLSAIPGLGADFQKVLKLFSGNRKALLSIGLCHVELKNLDAAETSLLELCNQKDAASDPDVFGLANYNLGVICEKRANSEDADRWTKDRRRREAIAYYNRAQLQLTTQSDRRDCELRRQKRKCHYAIVTPLLRPIAGARAVVSKIEAALPNTSQPHSRSPPLSGRSPARGHMRLAIRSRSPAQRRGHIGSRSRSPARRRARTRSRSRDPARRRARTRSRSRSPARRRARTRTRSRSRSPTGRRGGRSSVRRRSRSRSPIRPRRRSRSKQDHAVRRRSNSPSQIGRRSETATFASKIDELLARNRDLEKANKWIEAEQIADQLIKLTPHRYS
jgi:hypothetical protein